MGGAPAGRVQYVLAREGGEAGAAELFLNTKLLARCTLHFLITNATHTQHVAEKEEERPNRGRPQGAGSIYEETVQTRPGPQQIQQGETATAGRGRGQESVS